MARLETSFENRDRLIFLRGEIDGPLGTKLANMVLDTGASFTTITPGLSRSVGYIAHEGQKTRVRTAIGSERGYVVELARISALGISLHNLPAQVFDLGHSDIDCLVGMNFLSFLNFEVRTKEQRILAELATRLLPASP